MLLYCHGDCRENKIKRLLFCFTERVYAKYYFIFYDDALIQYLSAQYPKYLYDVGSSIIEELAKINRVTNNFPRVKYHHLRFTTIKYNTVLNDIVVLFNLSIRLAVLQMVLLYLVHLTMLLFSSSIIALRVELVC